VVNRFCIASLLLRASTARCVTLEVVASNLTIPEPSVASPSDSAAKHSLWVYNPWIDLIIGCGAWSAPLLLLTAWAGNSSNKQWSFAFYFLALLFNYPHFMATIYRAYHSYDEFTKYRYFTVHIAVLLAVAGCIAHLWYPLLPWIFTLYICWSPWHYTGQNFGLLMMFARRAGAAPSESERRALRLSFVASYAMLMFSFHTGPSPDLLILSLGLPASFTSPARFVLGAFFIVASAWALRSISRRASWKALLPCATLVATQFLWFLLPAFIELLSGREVPQTRYSSGILAILHSAQYLWITSYFQEKEARAAGNASWSFPRYLLTLIAGGIALFIPGPWIVSRVFHVDFAASFLTFTALVNLHHFLLDGAIWKLRDSRIATFLLNKRESSTEVAVEQESPLRRSGRWLAGTSTPARTLRVTVVLALLLWGGVDLLHFFWANVSANLSSLKRAAQLNPNDSSLQLRLARASSAAGDNASALTELKQAADINPSNLSLQEIYARALITAGRDDDAYALYSNVLSRSPGNIDALVNYGILASRLGHPDIAVDSWQRALAIDPMQSNAQLYLAQFLQKRGETQAAARHYHAYLQIVSRHPEQHRSEGPAVVSAFINVADADAAAHHESQALKGYQAAAQFAQKLGDASLQSLALAHAAEVQEQRGDVAAALTSFQQALALDDKAGDARSSATDWFNYAQFLRRHGQPERLVYACLLKSGDLLSATPGEELSAIAKAQDESAARLGAAAQAVRTNFASIATQAASLAPSSLAAAAR
jgi:tetratricopeptide (TPR) repeat protein